MKKKISDSEGFRTLNNRRNKVPPTRPAEKEKKRKKNRKQPLRPSIHEKNEIHEYRSFIYHPSVMEQSRGLLDEDDAALLSGIMDCLIIDGSARCSEVLHA